MIRFLACKVFILVSAISTGALVYAEEPLKEEKIQFEGVKYRVVRMPAGRLELAWKGTDGKPMRSFDQVQKHYAAKKRKVTFMTNAGIFEPGGVPSGLYVQGHELLRPLNLRPGKGNFFLKPNGVFAIQSTKGGARPAVIESSSYKSYVERALKAKDVYPFRIAIQSGPLLLSQGKIHPAFNRESKSRLHRNGVGVDQQRRVVFAITEFHAGSEGEVNLHGFARLFLHLGCQNALFLDGDLSQMVVNPKEKVNSNLFGAMFVVTEPQE